MGNCLSQQNIPGVGVNVHPESPIRGNDLEHSPSAKDDPHFHPANLGKLGLDIISI